MDSFLSKLPLVGDGVTHCQWRIDKVEFTCSNELISYNKYLGYVDVVDFDKNCLWVCRRKIWEMIQTEM